MRPIWMIACFITIAAFSTLSSASIGDLSDLPLSKFIIGRWQDDFSNSLQGREEGNLIQLEFEDSDTLLFNQVSNGQVYPYNWVFEYEFSANNVIHLRSREVMDLQLSEDGEDLWITAEQSAGWIPSGRYKRVPTIPWPLLSLVLGIVCITVLRNVFRLVQARMADANYVSMPTRPAGNRLSIGLQAIAWSTAIAVGVLVSYSLREYWHVLLIRPPWDGGLLIELSLCTAAAGFKMAFWKAARPDLPFTHARWSWRQYVGAASIGFALFGLLFGSAHLFIVLAFGAYPF